jgi:hypothetical protein
VPALDFEDRDPQSGNADEKWRAVGKNRTLNAPPAHLGPKQAA